MPTNQRSPSSLPPRSPHRCVILSEAIHIVNRAVEGPAVCRMSHRFTIRQTSSPAFPTPRSNPPLQNSPAQSAMSFSPGTIPLTASPAQSHPLRKHTSQRKPVNCSDIFSSDPRIPLACTAPFGLLYCQSLQCKDYGSDSLPCRRSTPDHSLRQHSNWSCLSSVILSEVVAKRRLSRRTCSSLSFSDHLIK
jgi:hypothetical protein